VADRDRSLEPISAQFRGFRMNGPPHAR